MDLELNSEQSLLVDAVESLGARWRALPHGRERDYAYFANDFHEALGEAGFLRAGLHMGMLEAALVTTEVSRLPCVTGVGASALVAASLLGEVPQGPIALLSNDHAKAQRLLPVAAHAFAEDGEDAVFFDLAGIEVEPVDSIYAYPYGRFTGPLDLSRGHRIAGAAPRLRQWRRVALAAECAGAAQRALGITLDHVKERFVFGRAVGSFQAVQHRLAQCHQIARAIRYLTLHAARSCEAEAADIAATYAQDHVNKLAFDLHQFNGGMGVTNEHPLHFFTYRLRALQAEVGGADYAARSVYERFFNRYTINT
jgi:alkylation response protein AidB-like acyl-CoA dehydrogenase